MPPVSGVARARGCHHCPRWARGAEPGGGPGSRPRRGRGRGGGCRGRREPGGCHAAAGFLPTAAGRFRLPGAGVFRPPRPGRAPGGGVGPGVSGWREGDSVCALMAGGGYAERVAVPAGQLLPIPGGVSLIDAAALPEVACTVNASVFGQARLAPGEVLLVHGGSGGIGTMAIQLAKARGAVVACTAGTPAKLERCRELGADLAISYRDQDFVTAVRDFTGGRGADVILDIIGTPYLARNIEALATSGRLLQISTRDGVRAEVDLGVLMRKRISIFASTLRARPVAEKAVIVADVREQVWPLVAAGQVGPVIDRRLPLAEAGQAQLLLEHGTHVGKILLV